MQKVKTFHVTLIEDYSYTQPSNSETGLGVLDHGSAKEAEGNASHQREKYIKYSAVQGYEIGKYVSNYSTANTFRKYKGEFTQLNESTVRSFGRKLPTARRGRPLMLGKIDLMV